ncbi:bifunctional 3-(3-hydroxy-phenyl)propionate/3-hydroxycinnamic acid hydroxylase [Pseudonocardia sp. WMMC193]|uniref:bifunctional 3-(3-hydroxy-phenyl)propionate/3-hydroxycinnamic acid hydroxylase MhpA n=1 Tax=Pseudonocardia sp. WMMC193 TaxID=2911965 RepID=UPI001F465DBB|nr:bifunctional 3-(3-hydroxy-phenyl)propionate/3-hydroxycinnamic acid hydroxylase [Pseudonocardia sp. WMMC193]MCF7553631.1 bifunctional 3-(3-hydroxy-phenyl)propionate/3-hydroxycinnamic acid hydroxylase [Pseudonocardia sp. WMMC193]
MDFDVAIVGLGPTGMTLAALLAQQGRSVVALERYPGLYNLPRAAAFDDETMRTFQKLGVAEKMLPGTNVQSGYVWVNGQDDVLLDIQYDNPGRCGWPAQYMMYQPHVEQVLDELLRSSPAVDVRRGLTVTAVTDLPDGVQVEARHPDGSTHRVGARYLVGCDGGNGFVREHLNGVLDDYGFFENWLVCDFRLRRDVPGLPTFRQVCDPAEPIAIVNIGPEHHRFSFRLDADVSREDAVQPENVWPRVASFLTPEDADLVRVANYTFRSSIVDTWRRGRVLLAGDAAHQMPPFLAQGMVSGIRDARNLAWKVDMVLSGHAEELLDTYQVEREPHVRFITEKAIELGRVQTMRDVEQAKERDARMIAARKANRAPDKLRYPPLQGGLIANHGDLFPQGLVSTAERTALFDEIAGTGWLIVANGRGAFSAVSPDDQEAFAGLGGRQLAFGFAGMFGGAEISDTGGVYARWFADTGCVAAIVRPDSHVYGLARDPDELATLTKDLLGALGRP